MKTYLAKWPNGTISLFTASNHREIYDCLDTEGDPSSVELFRCSKSFLLGTEIVSDEIWVDIWDGKLTAVKLKL